MRILVCGSRDWCNRYAIWSRLRTVAREDPHAVIIHGGASRKPRGVEQSADMLADAAARALGLAVEPHPADWKRHGKKAGALRNLEMLDSGVDRVEAFQRNGSRGTQHTIDEARLRGIPVEVFTAS